MKWNMKLFFSALLLATFMLVLVGCIQNRDTVKQPEVDDPLLDVLPTELLVIEVHVGVEPEARVWEVEDPTIETTMTPIEPTPTAFEPTSTLRPSRTPTPVPSWRTDFVEPVLAYISDRPPDIVDYFTTSNAWEMRDGAAEWRKSVKNGELRLEDTWASHSQMRFYDYVVDVTARHITGTEWVGVEFTNGADVYCRFWVLKDGLVEAGCSNSPIRKHHFQSYSYNLRIIVKGSQIAFYVNGELLGYIENEAYRLYRGPAPIFAIGGMDKVGFSEFNVWNLSRLEIP